MNQRISECGDDESKWKFSRNSFSFNLRNENLKDPFCKITINTSLEDFITQEYLEQYDQHYNQGFKILRFDWLLNNVINKIRPGWYFTKCHLSWDILSCGNFHSKFILLSEFGR